MKSEDLILIADGGSTKVEWCLASSAGRTILAFEAEGLNLAQVSPQQAEAYFRNVAAKIDSQIAITKIYFYGSGCSTPEICARVAERIDAVWHPDAVEVASDTLAACRALLGNTPGVACILGTGSNSALYDGSSIVSNIASLGYILDDEGSGSALGKQLLGDVFKGIAPAEVIADFLRETKLNKGAVLQHLYREPAPNRFLASFAPFICNRLDNPYFKNLVAEAFTRFFSRNVLLYPGLESLTVNFIGSIAAHFEAAVREVGNRLGLNIGRIEPKPMPGLIEFHTRNK